MKNWKLIESQLIIFEYLILTPPLADIATGHRWRVGSFFAKLNFLVNKLSFHFWCNTEQGEWIPVIFNKHIHLPSNSNSLKVIVIW